MLARKQYDQAFIDACRARVQEQLGAYRELVAAARAAGVDGQIHAFEPQFLRSMVVVLDGCFLHRARGAEGKDGNPANEVRVLAVSINEHDGVLVPDSTIELDPERSVLGLRPGDPIAPDADAFARLADGYFAEIERRFTPTGA